MSEEKKKNQIVAGDMRPSQLIRGFGPGSIISMENDAVMILGCQAWPKKNPEEKRYEILIHPLLSKILGVKEIRMPFSRDNSRVIPAISFPQWGVCKNKECQILQKHERVPGTKNGFTCIHCDRKGKLGKLIHARLVVICEKGHIDEFPWIEWLHQKTEQKCSKSDKPIMKFKAEEKTSGLGDYSIRCVNCGAYRTISGSTDKSKFEQMPRCSGRRPWLPEFTGDSEPCINEKTHEPSIVRGIQIRAPSLYYPIGISAIKIPQWAHPVYDRLFDEKDEGKLQNTIESLRQNNLEFSQIVETLRTDFQPIENSISEQKRNEGLSISDEMIKEEIVEKLEKFFEDDSGDDDPPNQIEILNQEFDDISSIVDTKGKSYEDEFQLKTSDINEQEILKEYLNSLKKITRITSITALQGFTRAEPPDPINPDKEKMQRIVTKKFFHEHKWLPGIQNKGEGVFISLDIDKLKKWENLEEVKKRCNVLIESHALTSQPKNEEKRKEIEERYNARYILLHTLSHVIIKSMARHAGYNEASLNERIYWDGKDRNGILIYASSGTSEGSLGGLVRLGESDEFARILNDAIKESQSCSKDPICGESDPVEDKKNDLHRYMRLSGATCHSCTIVSETSCANFNHFLDRRLIMDEKFGFFKEIV